MIIKEKENNQKIIERFIKDFEYKENKNVLRTLFVSLLIKSKFKEIIEKEENKDVLCFVNDNILKFEKYNELINDNLKSIEDFTFEGDLFGYIYELFSNDSKKESLQENGEFFTPKEVSELCAKITSNGKSGNITVYDPTCGSGSLLIGACNKIENISKVYGQELNSETYIYSKINMILSGYDFDIKNGDTLEDDKFNDVIFDCIISNPPYSVKWNSYGKEKDERFNGLLAPDSKADYAFIQHIIHHLKDDGVATVIMPHGVLFRGSKEGKIRKNLIENNLIDTVIGLPENLFTGTSIPVCVLVLRKNKQTNDVLFIDASNNFKKNKKINQITNEHVNEILETFKERKEVSKFSHIASFEEIKDNDFNLNISRYVDTFEEEVLPSLDETVSKILEIEKKIKENNLIILDFCNQLGIKPPFSIGEMND